MIRAIVDLPFALAQGVGLSLMAPGSRRFALSTASFKPSRVCRETEVLRKSFIYSSCQQAERLPVFTNGSVSDSNQNHFILFAHFIRV